MNSIRCLKINMHRFNIFFLLLYLNKNDTGYFVNQVSQLAVILKKYPFHQELFLCKTFKLTALYDPPGGLGYHRTQTVACPNTRIL